MANRGPIFDPSSNPPPPGGGGTPPPAGNPTGPAASGSGGSGSGGGKKSDRDLIAAARKQAGSGSGKAALPSDLPADFFPGYELVREIHRGGQGVVYQAIQRTTKRKVAVKMLFEGLAGGSRGRARFEREVEILAQLNHPNIVSIVDSGQVGPSFFLVMDYISGQTLDAYIAGGPRSVPETLDLFGKICEAVNAAHLKGVVHRDLKPSNIRVDAAGEPHILDFGLAKVSLGDVNASAAQLQMMTMTGQFIGSLPWASPEQAEGAPDKVDVRSDVYSLGVVLFQMLTGGKFPYTVVGNMRDVLDNILRVEPQRPSTIRAQVNDEVETIVLKSLAKDRDRRYQSAGELGRDIRNYLTGKPIEAKRDSGWYVLKKTARRHRAAVAAGSIIAALVVASSIGFAILYRQASSAERKATTSLAGEREALAAATTAKDAEAAQRADAERNFAAMRRLARAQLDLSRMTRDLRGTTPARLRVLAEGEAFFDVIERRAPGNTGAADAASIGPNEPPAVLRELADLSEALGDIRAGLFQPRTAEFKRGEAAYARALALRERIAAADPENSLSHSDLAKSRLNSAGTLRQQLKHQDALAQAALAQESLVRAGMLAARLGGDELATARRTISEQQRRASIMQGDLQRLIALRLESPTEAEAAIRAAISGPYASAQTSAQAAITGANAADASKAARTLGELRDKHSQALREIGRRFRDEARRQADLNTPDSKIAAKAAFDRARALYAEALAEGEAAARDFEALSAARTASAELRRDLYIALHNAGHALQEDADTIARVGVAAGQITQPQADDLERSLAQRALTFFERARDVVEPLVAADEANVTIRRDLAICLNKIGNQLRDLGRADEAKAAFTRSLDLRNDLAATDATQQNRLDLAVGHVKLGEMHRVTARAATENPAKLAAWEAAAAQWRTALALYAALRDEGVLAADAREFAEIQRPLDDADAQIRALRGG
jgi:serine/threonine protein kinase